MRLFKITIIALLAGLLFSPNNHVQAQADLPVVRAVLFYSPTCGHCEYVINETLLPLIELHGEQLQIIGIDVTEPEGQTHFLSAMDQFNLEGAGVPFLVIDETYLIGSEDIPEQFPDLVENYLAHGGVDWPNIPGLTETLKEPQNTTKPAPTANWTDRFAQDPVGNTLAVVILLAMLTSVVWAAVHFKKMDESSVNGNEIWIVPLLCVIGSGVAGYLAYVETTNVAAVCGPVGDCNTVQQSEYARLFGILPIGVLGLVGYVTVFSLWLVARYGHKRIAERAAISSFGLAVLGTLFSIYLTFLEPFVIGATCAWCLTSAVLITMLMLLLLKPAKAAFRKQR